MATEMANNGKKSRDESMRDAVSDTTVPDGETSTELATSDANGSTALASVGPNGLANIAALSDKEQLAALAEAFGVDTREVEVIAGGSLPFWPAVAGAMVIGTVEGIREVPTKWATPENPKGLVTLYSVTLGAPAVVCTQDGEYYEAKPGDMISVLERSVLKELRHRQGQKVGILCVGKKQGKMFGYWDYKILGQRRTDVQVQTAALAEMARTQSKALPAAR